MFTVIAQIVRHTPGWVWGVLALLVALGAAQLRQRSVPRLRVALLPLGLSAYSLWGATALFGLHAAVIAAWAVGVALTAQATRGLPWAPGVHHDALTDRLDVPGSVWPLLSMLAVFALRYGVVVTLAFHPDRAADPLFAAGVSAAYGGLTGLLAGRALYLLGHAQPGTPAGAPWLAA
jgi:hypothetical protein